MAWGTSWSTDRIRFDFACTTPHGDHTALPPRSPLFTLRFNRRRPQEQGEEIWRIRRRGLVWWRRWRSGRKEKVPRKITGVGGMSGLPKGQRRASRPGCNVMLTTPTRCCRSEGVCGESVLRAQQPAVHREGVSCRYHVLPQDVCRVGTPHLALNDCCRGKGD